MGKKVEKKVPELRFKGFTDDWEQRKLGEEVQIMMGQSPNSENYTDNPNDHILVQGNADMKNGYVSPRVWTKQVTKQADKGDLILSVRAPVGDVGRTDYAVVIGRGVASIKGNEFMFQKLVKMKITGYWTRYSTGSTFESINSNDIKDAEISVPELEEQKKIGTFFKQLDITIALHQRKLELLQKMKQGFLQKMFPQKGEKLPEVRFANFDSDWEQRKLGEVVDTQIKGKAQLGKLEKGNIEYLDTARLNGGKALLTNGIQDVRKEDVLILWDGSKAGTVYTGFEGVLGSTLKAYKIIIDSQFVYQFLKRHQENIYNNYRTPNIPHVQKDFLDVFKISVPSNKEQQKLGSLLKQLDDTTILHQNKIENLKIIKKAFLQKMFV